MTTSKKVAERIVCQLKKYQNILIAAKARDISESDTVVIIGDMVADVLGYKKYSEITTEFAIRGTYVDLAVKVGDEVRFLIEAKAIGVELKDNHIKQAIDYGVNTGVEWIVLTNGAVWRFYKIHFRQPVEKTLLIELDLINGDIKADEIIECFGNLSREGFAKDSLSAFYHQQQVLSRHSLGAIILSPFILKALRRELRRLAPKSRVDEARLKNLLQAEVLKREIIEGEEASAAQAVLIKLEKKVSRKEEKSESIKNKDTDPKSNFALTAAPTTPIQTNPTSK